MANNPWQLYSSMHGWQEVGIRLQNATVKALEELDEAIAEDVPHVEAAEDAFKKVVMVMEHPDNSKFGAVDSEPRAHLAHLISKHFLNQHHIKMQMDRFGDALEVD